MRRQGPKIAARDNKRARRPKGAGIGAQIPAKRANMNLAGKYPVRWDWLVGTQQIETGCPPPSHRTSLELDSGTEIFNAETERQNRPNWPMF